MSSSSSSDRYTMKQPFASSHDCLKVNERMSNVERIVRNKKRFVDKYDSIIVESGYRYE